MDRWQNEGLHNIHIVSLKQEGGGGSKRVSQHSRLQICDIMFNLSPLVVTFVIC